MLIGVGDDEGRDAIAVLTHARRQMLAAADRLEGMGATGASPTMSALFGDGQDLQLAGRELRLVARHVAQIEREAITIMGEFRTLV